MQRLFGVSMVLGSGRELSADDAEARRGRDRGGARRAARRRSSARSSRPPSPSRTTLRAELERLGRQYKAVPISVWWEAGAEVPEGLEPLAVSVLGEALRNAEKHARPTEVRIAITSARRRLRARGPQRRHRGRRRGRAGARAAAGRLRVAAARRDARVRPRAASSGGCGWCCRPATSRASSRGCRAMAERPLRVLIVDDHDVVQWGFKVLLGASRGSSAAWSPPTRRRRSSWPSACSPTSPSSTSSSASAPAPSSARRSAACSPQTRVLLISGRRLDLAAGGADRRRLGLRLQGLERRRGGDGRAHGRQGDDRLRPPGGGAGDAAERARARGAGADRLRARPTARSPSALYLSPHTVKEHTSSLYRKLGVKNRAEAARRAERLGLTALSAARRALDPPSRRPCTPRSGG